MDVSISLPIAIHISDPGVMQAGILFSQAFDRLLLVDNHIILSDRYNNFPIKPLCYLPDRLAITDGNK